ncbi:MAG: hypothetical protein H6738_09870 [Alphaproteobacteria bacterium]|nr:hypothetical protein [Alphaproteobacteria bacterium]
MSPASLLAVTAALPPTLEELMAFGPLPETLSALPRLRSLAAAVAPDAPLPRLPALRDLVLRSTYDGLELLPDWLADHPLHALDLTITPERAGRDPAVAAAVARVLAALPSSLRTLTLSVDALDTDLLGVGHVLPSLYGLANLTLDAGVSVVSVAAREDARDLRRLRISEPLDREGAVALVTSPYLSGLEELQVHGLSADVAAALVRSARFHGIRSLTLGRVHGPGEQVLRALAAADHLASLETLRLELDVRDATRADAEAVANAPHFDRLWVMQGVTQGDLLEGMAWLEGQSHHPRRRTLGMGTVASSDGGWW